MIEHLIDISYEPIGDTYIVYDLSDFFKLARRTDRDRYLKQVAFSIKGSSKVIHIIDVGEVLNYESAKQLAIRYVANDFTLYRLD